MACSPPPAAKIERAGPCCRARTERPTLGLSVLSGRVAGFVCRSGIEKRPAPIAVRNDERSPVSAERIPVAPLVEGAPEAQGHLPQKRRICALRASRRCRGRRGRSVRRRVPHCEALVATELDWPSGSNGKGGAGLGLGGGRRGRHTSHFQRCFSSQAKKGRTQALRHPVPLGLCAPLSPARSTNKAKQDRHGRRAVPPILPSARRANAQLLLHAARQNRLPRTPTAPMP